MTGAELALLVIAGLLVIGLSFAYWANRVDRLHAQVDAARAALDHNLTRRADTALDLAMSGILDPASSLVMADIARECLAALDEPEPLGPASATLQSELSRTVALAIGESADVDAVGGPSGSVLGPMTSAWYRAVLARRFYNQAVNQARRLRQAWPVRVFRLAGRTPMPQTFDFEDRWPLVLGDGPS
ncbi:MAG: hypothetical protein LBG70_04985 [Bifidobacteriaceae bacterium]|jgi:hypothetical protein|nr:hypothetical protein [Bifidobacteriaceae bacterium]